MLIHRWKEVTKEYNSGMMVELFRFSDGKEYYIGRTRWDQTFYIDDEKEAQKIIELFELKKVY